MENEHIFKYMIFQKRHYGVIMGEACKPGGSIPGCSSLSDETWSCSLISIMTLAGQLPGPDAEGTFNSNTLILWQVELTSF